MVEVKFKKMNEKAVIPYPATEMAAGLDLVATSFEQSGNVVTVGTGLCVAIPPGYEGQVRSRSGMASKGTFVVNSPGTIDSDYRGEIKILLTGISAVPLLSQYRTSLKIGPVELNIGDRVAQLCIREVPTVSVVEVDELDETERGVGGFGSTGLSQVREDVLLQVPEAEQAKSKD